MIQRLFLKSTSISKPGIWEGISERLVNNFSILSYKSAQNTETLLVFIYLSIWFIVFAIHAEDGRRISTVAT